MTLFKLAAVLWVWVAAQSLIAGEGVELHKKLEALQQAFCGQQKQEEITKKIHTLVEARVAELSPAAREKMPPLAEVVANIKEQVWTTFHVHALCLEQPRLERTRVTGAINGYFTGSFLEGFGIQTLIHEGGHAAMAHLVYQNSVTEIHVVKFDVFVRFCSEVFSGNGNLTSFLDLLNPMGGVTSSSGGIVHGWTNYTVGTGLTKAGAAMGSSGAEACILLGGLIFTSIAQITGIIVGLYLKDRHPFVGYTLIVACASTYISEMINWFSIAAAIQTGGMASSDLARVSLILGISSFVVPGVMLGVSAAGIATYIGVSKYLRHLKELRVSAKSLLNEGILSSIQGGNQQLLDELWAKYPRKNEFDAAIAKMAKHMEKTSAKYIELQVKTLSAQAMLPPGDTLEKDPAKSFKDYLPDGSTFKHMWENFLYNRKIKAFKSELREFYHYIGHSDEVIDLDHQDETAKAAIAKILQGKYLIVKDGWFKTKVIPQEVREKMVDNYLRERRDLPLHKLVTANVERVKFNEHLASSASKRRWRQVITNAGYKDLRKRRSWFFAATHMTYTYFISDLEFFLQGQLTEFAKYKDGNDLVGMEKSAKKLLKDVLFIPKEYRDIAAAIGPLTTYVNAVQSQQREKIKKRWLLDVVDEDSCKVEVDFVCSLAAMMFKDTLANDESYKCPLEAPRSCGELRIGKGLLRSVFTPPVLAAAQ